MKERRKRLLQNIYLREKNQDINLPKILDNNQPGLDQNNQDYSLDFQKDYETKEAQKNVIIQGFSAQQLEEMLRTSTRNVAYEVISCLIDSNGRGVLTEIIKFLTISNKHIIEVEENGSSILDNLNKKTNYYGRHHNYYQNGKYGHKVARIDESEEDTESYAGVGKQTGNQTRAYNISTANNQSSASSTGPNSSNDIRIKIRKNSIEPNIAVKANHKQMVRQRLLKEQQRQTGLVQHKKPNNQDILTDSEDLRQASSTTPKADSKKNNFKVKNFGFSDMNATEESKFMYEGKGPLAQMQAAVTQSKGCFPTSEGSNQSDQVRKLFTHPLLQKIVSFDHSSQVSKTARNQNSKEERISGVKPHRDTQNIDCVSSDQSSGDEEV